MPRFSLDAKLLRRIEELQQRCRQRQQITYTDFLDVHTAAQIQQLPEFHQTNHIFSGGYADADRKILFFLPDWQEKDTFYPELLLKLLKITPAASQGLTHRDYLGSLLALGVKREKIGDILVLTDCAEVIILPSLLPYLTSNLAHIGRTSAIAAEIPFEELVLPQRHFSTTTRTVARLRCDSVLAAAFSLSRSEAVSAIMKGLVTVNHLSEDKPDRLLPSECMLSIRGKGRVQIKAEADRSRKGRIFIHIIREM